MPIKARKPSTLKKRLPETVVVHAVPIFQNRRTLANHVEDNMQCAGRKTFFQRLIFIAKHLTPNAKDLKDKFEEIIKHINKFTYDEKLTGFLLIYNLYSIHMVEGSEHIINVYLKALRKESPPLFSNSRITLIYNNANQISLSMTNANWGTPESSQYHIQTDEGPERYFRYQTDNGQYRKEKRLADGTVIGTEAWIDALGYMRQKDYIADKQGYRILKSKTVFVGQNRPIQDAIKEAKRQPPSSGILVTPGEKTNLLPNNAKPYYTTTTTSAPPTSTTSRPTLPIVNILPNAVSSGYEYPSVPTVYIRPQSSYLPVNQNPISSTTVSPNSQYLPSFPDPPSNYDGIPLLPPRFNSDHPSSTPIAIFSPTSTPSPHFDFNHPDIHTPIAVYPPSSTPRPPIISSTTSRPDYDNDLHSVGPLTPTAIVELNNDLSQNGYSPDNRVIPLPTSTLQPPITNIQDNNIYPQYYSTTARPALDSSTAVPYSRNNVPNNQQNFNPNQYYQPSPNYNQLGNGYDPQYPYYDGVSVTNNGFRYYLPRQYHEEENSGSAYRSGSFGYIDPFGIRRVIYYNTSPNQGFVHRKNNRYVGFNATPYDPRPV